MKNIIIIPDSFKGSMSAIEVCDILAEVVEQFTSSKVIKLPIADGGEGTVDCLLTALKGEKKQTIVTSPEGKDILASYGIANGLAIIEIAESSGITKQTSYNAPQATTYGFGQLILDALDMGCRDFLLALGGSATTDGGCGMASALGVEFFDDDGNSFIPVGATLAKISKISLAKRDARIEEATFKVMCDVDNPLYGKNGAAYIYGPQKGANEEEVVLLDEGLINLAKVLKETTGIDYSNISGAGAAGGVGAGCCAFLNGELESGIELILNITNFDELVKDCELIITGEGKIDEQSLMGKTISGIKAHSNNVKMLAFCGTCTLEDTQGIEVVEIGKGLPLEESISKGKYYLKEKAFAYFSHN